MNELRKHLGSARDEYESTRYPGDLGAQILGRTQPSRNGRWVVGVIFAAAAALFIVLWLNVPGPRDLANNSIASVPDDVNYTEDEPVDTEEEYVYTDIPMLSFPAVPEEIEFAPVAPSFSIGVPTFSLLGEETSEQESSNI